MQHQPSPNLSTFKLNPPLIAIDGYAASGKGTLAKALASYLDYAYLDTGKIYRAVAWSALKKRIDPQNTDHILALIPKFDWSYLDRTELHQHEVAEAASVISVDPKIRSALLDLQRHFAHHPPAPFRGAVLDGRDIGTVICPEAFMKFFIFASVEVRAQRRVDELQNLGISIIYEQVLRDLMRRDQRDQERKVAPMIPASDAVVIDSSFLSADEVFALVIDLLKNKISTLFSAKKDMITSP